MPDPNTIPEHFELPNTAGVYNEFFTEFNEMRIDEYDKGKKKRVPTAIGLGSIIKLLETLELDSWEELENTFVRCEIENNSIIRIGHLIKDKWFSFTEYYHENNKTETNVDINCNYKLRDINTELHRALHELVVEVVEYMILNSLGDPYKNRLLIMQLQLWKKH